MDLKWYSWGGDHSPDLPKVLLEHLSVSFAHVTFKTYPHSALYNVKLIRMLELRMSLWGQIREMTPNQSLAPIHLLIFQVWNLWEYKMLEATQTQGEDHTTDIVLAFWGRLDACALPGPSIWSMYLHVLRLDFSPQFEFYFAGLILNYRKDGKGCPWDPTWIENVKDC